MNVDCLDAGETFDFVLSTHTLEHVINLREHVDQLLARASATVLFVVPLQINLRYTPDLHTRFWRQPGEFFLDAGIKPWMKPEWYVDKGDLCVILDMIGHPERTDHVADNSL